MAISRPIPFSCRLLDGAVTACRFAVCWLFNVIDEPVSGYYYLAEEETQVVSHLQKDDGLSVPFSPMVLEEMIGEDERLIRLIRKQRFVQAIKDYNEKYKVSLRINSTCQIIAVLDKFNEIVFAGEVYRFIVDVLRNRFFVSGKHFPNGCA